MKRVNPSFDSQVLLFYGMSENSVLLPEEISSSEADTDSVVAAAGTDIAIYFILHVPLEKKFFWRGEFGLSSKTACFRRSWPN